MQLGRDKSLIREINKNKERKKRGNRKYGQAKFKHARKGILSSMIAALVAVILITLVITAFVLKGQSAAIIGSFGIFTVILALIGLVTGIKGFRERDKNYLTCKIGVGVNGAVLLALIAIFIRGLI